MAEGQENYKLRHTTNSTNNIVDHSAGNVLQVWGERKEVADSVTSDHLMMLYILSTYTVCAMTTHNPISALVSLQHLVEFFSLTWFAFC